MQEVLIPTTTTTLKESVCDILENRSLLYDKDKGDLFVKYENNLNEIGGSSTLERINELESTIEGKLCKVQLGESYEVNANDTTWVAPCDGILFWYMSSSGLTGSIPLRKNDSISNQVTDASKIIFYPFNIELEDSKEYSLDEKRIGKWIDGSSLYQKTFQISNSNNIDLTALNINIMISISGTAKKNTGEFVGINYGDSNSSTFSIENNVYPFFASYNSNLKQLVLNSGTNVSYDIEFGFITIQYTKLA